MDIKNHNNNNNNSLVSDMNHDLKTHIDKGKGVKMNNNNSTRARARPEKEVVKFNMTSSRLNQLLPLESYICTAKKKMPRCWGSVLT